MATTASISTDIASLESFSSALSSFTSSWRSLESHLSTIDSSLTSRLAALPEPPPPPEAELRRLCVAMDSVGLQTYLIEHRKELKTLPEKTLDDAILAAPDPARLALGATHGFCRALSDAEKDGDLKVMRRTCLELLDRLRTLGVRALPLARAEAREVAAEWRRKLGIGKQGFFMETLAFLLLVGVYGLVEDVGGVDEVLELVVSIAGRKRAVDVFVGLGLDLTEHMPVNVHGLSSVLWLDQNIDIGMHFSSSVLIQKMKSKGRQLEAVKFICAVNLVDKYPLLPILRSYMDDAAKAGNRVCSTGNNSEASQQNAAGAKELASLRILQKFIKEQMLEELPIVEQVEKRIKQLEKQWAEKKRTKSATAAAAAAADEVSKNILQQKQQPAKRPRLSAAISASATSSLNIPPVMIQSQHQVASNQNVRPVVFQSQHQVASNQNIRPVMIQSQHQVASNQNFCPVGSSDEPPYGGLAGYYCLASSRYLYDPVVPGPSDPGASLSRSQLYSADRLAAGSGASDRMGSSYNYSLSSMSTYNPYR